MLGSVRLSKPPASAPRWRRMNGVMVVMAMFVVLGGLSPSIARAQKNINFTNTGSVTSKLVFTNQISPDVYSFFATAGERIRVQTSNSRYPRADARGTLKEVIRFDFWHSPTG